MQTLNIRARPVAQQQRKVSVQASNQQAKQAQKVNPKMLMNVAAIIGAVAISAPIAQADLIGDLKAKSEANKSLNEKKRLIQSYAAVERSRTVADGTCKFPSNLFGCEPNNISGDVKYIADEPKIECQNTEPGKCEDRVDFSRWYKDQIYAK